MGSASYKSKALTFKDRQSVTVFAEFLPMLFKAGFAAANCAAVFQIDSWEAVTP
jgi:hypothetical protein